MTNREFEIAGVKIRLSFHGTPPPEISRYEPFAAQFEKADMVFDLEKGRLHGLVGFTGHVTARAGRLRICGAEHLGALNLTNGRGEAIFDPDLVVVDTFVRALVARRAGEAGGVLLHAAAVRVDGRVHLVPGRSGTGKTTFSAAAGDPLTDELSAVVPDGAGYLVHGTPFWKSRGGFAPLFAIYELKWGGERIEPLPRALLLRHLASSLVLPEDVPEERERAFKVCGELALKVPFRRATFDPTTDVDALLRGSVRSIAA